MHLLFIVSVPFVIPGARNVAVAPCALVETLGVLGLDLLVFFPVPLLLVPFQLIVPQEGMLSWNDSAAIISHIWVSFLSALFGLIPGVLRGSMVLRQLIPESQLPGRLVIIAAPFCSVVYLLTLSVALQFTANSYLIAGLSLLAAAPWVCWIRRSALLRWDTMDGARRTVRWINGLQNVLTVAGLVLLVWFFWDVPMLSSLLGKLNLIWFLELLAGTLANRVLFTVVMCDYVLTLLYSSQVIRQTPAGKELEQKIVCIGAAISG